MNLEEIFNRKLLIISGKGGVGKTTVALTLGELAAKRGKKTLIAEINSAEKISQIYQLKPIGYKETELKKNLFAINIDPHSAFHEYILEQIHSETIYHFVFENNLVKNFLDATPGLNSLLEIGKVWALTERDKNETGEKSKYDLVIIDAPATGHGLALLQVPQIVASAVRVGPIRTKADNIVQLLKDKTKTLLMIVTLGEEMPVNEAMEMFHQAEEKIGIAVGPFLMNALYPAILNENDYLEIQKKLKNSKDEKAGETVRKILHYYQKKLNAQNFYFNQLKKEIGNHDLMSLPYLFNSSFDSKTIRELADSLETKWT